MRLKAFFVFSLISIFLIGSVATAQVRISGWVVDATNQEPLAFVSIGIPRTQYGTISNEDGSFELEIPTTRTSMIFSYVGYEKFQVQTDTLSEGVALNVNLKPSPNQLESVLITANEIKSKQRKVGNPYGSSSIVLSDSVYSGAEIALRMNLKEQELTQYVKEVRFKVKDNTLGEVKARPRFYKVDPKTGSPGVEITSTDHIVRSKIQNGWIEVNFEEVLEVSDDFFLSIEWLFDRDDRKAISRSYHDFKTYHPGLIQTKYAFVNGKRVPYEDFGGNLKVGWSISCSTEPNVSSRHSAYVRYNSFGAWNISTAVPVMQVLVTN